MPNPVVHFEVIGRDGAALQRFYADLFDWKVDANNSMNYGLVEKEEHGIPGGIGGPGPDGYPGHVTFYVEVEDIAATLAQAERLGGKTIFGPETIMEGLVLGQFTDPEGHVIGLTQGRG
jgi:predicted enzyme related to lactoylglutathione lyase